MDITAGAAAAGPGAGATKLAGWAGAGEGAGMAPTAAWVLLVELPAGTAAATVVEEAGVPPSRSAAALAGAGATAAAGACAATMQLAASQVTSRSAWPTRQEGG
jgi:hypothetical protein